MEQKLPNRQMNRDLGNGINPPIPSLPNPKDLLPANWDTTPIIDCTVEASELAVQVQDTDSLEMLMRDVSPEREDVSEEKKMENMAKRYKLGHVYDLLCPITHSGIRITAVEFSKSVKGKAIGSLPIAKIDDWTVNQWMTIVGHCTGLSAYQMNELEAMDSCKLIEIAASFLQHGPLIG